jgi:DNA-directed RNA polymerase sigma subunit (sigma70/sigma32)
MHKKYNKYELMDLISESNIALIRAIKTYRDNHVSKTSFASYATFIIDRELNEYIQKNRFIYDNDGYHKLKQ